MNGFALFVAYIAAGLGFYGMNQTKPFDKRALIWNNPLACALLWPITFFLTPWYGAFFGTLMNAAIAYAAIAFLMSMFH